MATNPETVHKMATIPETYHNMAANTGTFHEMAASHESHPVMAAFPESSHLTPDHPESCHITADRLESGHFLSVAPRFPKYPRLASSMEDSPLVSAGATGIPKPTHSIPPVPELITLSEALPMMRIALWCVWAAYTTFGLHTHHRTSQGGGVHYDFSRGCDWLLQNLLR